jgi:diguanylate cyclase (GGDEF)-like protein
MGVFAAAVVTVSVNAAAPYGHEAAEWIAVGLQSVAGIGATVTAVLVARRVSGVSRTWRLLCVAAMMSWLVGEVLWCVYGVAKGANSAPAAGVVAYFFPPVLSLTAMALLARVGGVGRGGSSTSARVVAVLDGLVAALAFAMLASFAGLGALNGATLPRSDAAAVVVAYSALESVMVVSAVLMAMAYRRNRPFRANYFLLAGGVVQIAASDRMVAYLRTVGVENGDLWGGIGAVLGPLTIWFALMPLQPSSRGEDVMDWVQTVVPYVGFLGIVVLAAFHVLIGQQLSGWVVSLGVAMVFLVTVRQFVALRAQQLLTRQLYETQLRLAHQVNHDALTGLPNRLLFAQQLDDAIGNGAFVLIFVDIDDFKEVNDRFGHAAGDELLCAVGERLRRHVGDTDTLARIGGDEFAILVDGEVEAPELVADRLRVALREPFAVHGTSVRVRASMGLVRPGPDEPTPTSDDLLRQADISMYAGKRLGKDMAVVYRPSSGIVVDFPTALRKAGGGVPKGFSLAYQPVVRLPEGRPVAVEALARWAAPNGMQIPPETFVALAEGAGLGATLDALVLDLACQEVDRVGLDLDIHVNIGAARLGSLDFEHRLTRTLQLYGIEPGRVVVEITETVPIVDLTDGAAAIRRLSAVGVKVALDDFGAGYNSLTYLHALPVQIIKLDRSLAVGAEREGNLALYRSVVGLADALGLDVIAEGIESPAQADTVLTAGCRMAQGHLFGRPMPIDQICERALLLCQAAWSVSLLGWFLRVFSSVCRCR